MKPRKVLKLSLCLLGAFIAAMIIIMLLWNNMFPYENFPLRTLDPSSQEAFVRFLYSELLQELKRGCITGKYSNPCLSNLYDISQYCTAYSSAWRNVGYVYSPVTKEGTSLSVPQLYYRPARFKNTDRLQTFTDSRDHFFFYVPATSEVSRFWAYMRGRACGNFRWFVFIKKGAKRMRVDRISWYYQCRIEDLSAEELTKEKQYRAEMNLPQ